MLADIGVTVAVRVGPVDIVAGAPLPFAMAVRADKMFLSTRNRIPKTFLKSGENMRRHLTGVAVVSFGSLRFLVDEEIGLAEMRRAEGYFFQTAHGKRDVDHPSRLPSFFRCGEVDFRG